MGQAVADAPRHYLPSRSELSSPGNDWEQTWYLARQQGLGSELTTFLWKLLHKLLPTQNRLLRMKKSRSSQCQLCTSNQEETLEHAFFLCTFNNGSGSLLLDHLRNLNATITPSRALLLDFKIDHTLQFSVVWLAGNFLMNIWNARSDKKQIRLYKIRADLESRASLLRESRYSDNGEIILEMLQQIFV